MDRTEQDFPDDLMNAGDLAWFQDARVRLLGEWERRAQYRDLDLGDMSLACKLVRERRPPASHLSLPCSLAGEANHVRAILQVSELDRDPVLFLRLYLIVLHEFRDRMKKLARELKLTAGWQPGQQASLSAWANNVGKHLGALISYHHPIYLFLDSVDGPASEALLGELAAKEPSVVVVDRGVLDLLDQRRAAEYRADANSARLAVIVVPPLQEFLEDAMAWYAAFVQAVEDAGAATLALFEAHNHDDELAQRLRARCEIHPPTSAPR